MINNVSSEKNENFGQYIAFHMKKFRKKSSLSQEQLSVRSGVPRSTIASLERGEGNPTLQVLTGIAAGLGVSMASMLEKPVPTAILRKKADYKKIPKQLINEKSDSTTNVYLLTPENSRYLVMQKYVLNAGEMFRGSPHTPGTEEYFYSVIGTFEITIESEVFHVEAGDFLCFDGHQKHAYACHKNFEYAEGISIIVQVPQY